MANKQQTNTIFIAVAVGVVAAAAGFFGGMKYQQSQAIALRGQFQNGFRQGGGQFGGGRGGNRPVSGEVVSADATSITVKLPDGSTKLVLLSDKTAINKAAQATAADLTAGTRVAAFGTQNQDGSITATNVQINPVMMDRRMSPTPMPTK